jgi:16S rRNA (adenine1518-N6/adenine1519-N6)-dimethyltransferase
VWSTIVSLRPKQGSAGDEDKFKQIVSLAFRQKRKTILNNLKQSVSGAEKFLNAASIEPRRRAETLTLDEWLKLYEVIKQDDPA